MARIRTIKPEFFTSESTGELSLGAKVTFIGMWTLADKEGRLKDRPKWIKIQIFPYHDADVETWLAELSEAGLIVRYEAVGEAYIQITNFVKHQRPHPKEPESTIPSPYIGKNNGKKRTAVKENEKPLKETAGMLGREGKGMESRNGDGSHSSPNNSRLCDDEYLAELQQSEAYKVLDVQFVHAKMVEWCKQKRKIPTRNRLLGWLNREDRPMNPELAEKKTKRGFVPAP